MQAEPIPPHLRTLAPIVALRLGLILASLAALVARGFLRNPRLAPLIIPLWTRLTRSARRFSKLMARLAAGHLPHPSRPGGPNIRGRGGRAPKPPIPTTNAWLVRALHHEAAALGSQLAYLLAEPGVADLLAAAPATQRILNPIRRALGLPTGAPRPAPAPPPSTPRAAPLRTAPLRTAPVHRAPPPAAPCRHLLASFPFRPPTSRAVFLSPAILNPA